MNKWLIFPVAVLLLFSLQAKAVEYELPDMNGDIQSFDQYLGKWVVVNYWATWCTTCIKELPELIELHESNKEQDIAVIGINFETIDNQRLKKFVAEKGITYPVLRTEPVPVTAIGKVPALPATYIINPEGKVVAGNIGIVTKDDIENYISKKKSEKNILDEAQKVSYQAR